MACAAGACEMKARQRHSCLRDMKRRTAHRDCAVVQLKLRREPAAAVRSSATGQWHPYLLVGGALTKADGGQTSEALLA